MIEKIKSGIKKMFFQSGFQQIWKTLVNNKNPCRDVLQNLSTVVCLSGTVDESAPTPSLYFKRRM